MPSRYKSRERSIQGLPATKLTWSFRTRSTGLTSSDTFSGNNATTRYAGEASQLTYQTGNDGSMRPCSHSTTKYIANPIPNEVCLWRSQFNGQPYDLFVCSGVREYTAQKYISSFKIARDSAINSATLSSVPWSSLAQNALEAMLPSFGGQNSLVNFLLELKDFRRIAAALTSKISTKFDVLSSLVGTSSRTPRGIVKKPLKNLSSSYLQTQFGWKPLYYDLVRFVTSLTDFAARYESIKSMANTDLQAHFRTLVSGSGTAESLVASGDSVIVPGTTAYCGILGAWRVRALASDPIQYSATLRYRYPLPVELASAGGKVKAFLDVLGVSKDPSIVWNAIPFTFLIDYFVNIGDWLSRLRIDNIQFKTEIRDFCHSAKVTRAAVYEQRACSGYSGPTNLMYREWTPYSASDFVKSTQYQRKKGIPNFLTAFQVTGLNQYEFSIAGALLGANVSKRHR